MDIKAFKGFSDLYPERVPESDSWYYAQGTPCAEAYEVPDYKGEYPGTRLVFIEYPTGRVHEPIKQEKNVFLSQPVFHQKDQNFGIIRYDFNTERIQVISYHPESEALATLYEMNFVETDGLENIGLITSPIQLVKYNVYEDTLEFLWPEKKHIQFEENEDLSFQEEDKLYTSKWVENPDYSAEVIIRDANTTEVLQRGPGYLIRLPNGMVLNMTL